MIPLPPAEVLRAIDIALEEDVGTGDVTTEWTVSPGRVASARIIAKAEGVIAGTDIARTVFRRVSDQLSVEVRVEDGARVFSGDEVLTVKGPAASILTGERVALNFVQRMSGIATLTRGYVDAVSSTSAQILDTRKTTPGLRRLERAAVRAGGGVNHRFGLYEMVLIKENHIRAAGGITAAVETVRRHNLEDLAIEVETTDMAEVQEAVSSGVDRILFDNMPLALLQEAVDFVRGADALIETEASGGISLQNVRAVAETGVDFISVGALTHSAPALDLSLLIDDGSDL